MWWMIWSSANLTLGVLAYLSSALLYPTGQATTLANHNFSNPSISSNLAGLNHSIGQASIPSNAAVSRRKPSAIYICLLARCASCSGSFCCTNPDNIFLNPSSDSTDTPLVCAVSAIYDWTKSSSTFNFLHRMIRCDASVICFCHRACSRSCDLSAIFSTITKDRGWRPKLEGASLKASDNVCSVWSSIFLLGSNCLVAYLHWSALIMSAWFIVYLLSKLNHKSGFLVDSSYLCCCDCICLISICSEHIYYLLVCYSLIFFLDRSYKCHDLLVEEFFDLFVR